MMKRSAYKYLLAMVIIMIGISCKKAYNPTAVDANLNLLVVEGMINTGGVDSTIIKLSRTSNVGNSVVNKPELRAIVTVESSNNATYTLTEKGLGTYFLTPRALGFTQKFWIRIKTGDGRQYLSDNTEAKAAPAIDNINYAASSTGVKINLDSHDAANATRYYRWDYVEVWEYYSKYYSTYVSNGTKVVPRDIINNQIYHCWNTVNSSDILLASTVKLAQDVVSAQPIIAIDAFSPRISIKYSILLKQYALTEAEFNYWESVRKNNQNLGTIFDSQPSDSPGNIHCLSNRSEQVIGYVGAGAYSSKRLFIDRTQLPVYPLQFSGCILDTIYLVNPKTQQNDEDRYYNTPKAPMVPIDEYRDLNHVLLGHFGSTVDCVDCRTQGGITRKPTFWP
jgi:hypothetical protein